MKRLQKNSLSFGGYLVGLAAMGICVACSQSPTTSMLGALPAEQPLREACRVVIVFDGDTLACDLNGNNAVEAPHEYIRLLGIDTPESRFSKRHRDNPEKAGRDEPYAREASNFLSKAAINKTVYLEWDRERTDRFGRSLAFVFPAPDAATSLNEALVAEGYAQTLFLPPNEKYKARLEAVEIEARNNQRGLWHP